MAGFRANTMIFFLVPMLQLTVVTGEYSSLIVRDGADVTLPAGHEVHDGSRCGGIDWIWKNKQSTVDLVRGGQILPYHPHLDRLSLTENCSLVLKTVSKADAGVYHCQLTSTGKGKQVELSIIELIKHENGDEVSLACSVSSTPWCRHKVRLIYNGTDESQTETSQHEVCSESVWIPAGKLHSVKCEVTDGYSGVKHLFGVSLKPSLDKAGEDAAGTSKTAPKPTNRKGQTTSTDSKTSAADGWWMYLTAALGAVIFMLIILVLFIWWKKKKRRGKETETDDNAEDPEVSYASVSYTKRTSSEAQVQVRTDEDEGDTVTYSAVKVSRPSADQSSVYAAVNKPSK